MDYQYPNLWQLAKRTERMNPSAIREILKVTARPNIISFAGGLPSPQAFPISELKAACDWVFERDDPRAAFQYTTSEGHGPLRERVAKMLSWKVDPDQVLITTGSQQALDLTAKVLIDKGSRVLLETPTYLGGVQAFSPMEPNFISVNTDEYGVLPDDFAQKAGKNENRARFIYLQPNFQNPTGRTMSAERREVICKMANELGIPILEDNPYGELWFDEPPPPPLSSHYPDSCIYSGSFSKILAPGLRLGFLVAPKVLYPKLLQAKQAADLHTPSFNQRIVAQVMQDGFLEKQTKLIRTLYKRQRDIMLDALSKEMPPGITWNTPLGGMFLWVQLPSHINSIPLLDKAVKQGVAFVPGEPFYANEPINNTLRLSFVTTSEEEIRRGIKILAEIIANEYGE